MRPLGIPTVADRIAQMVVKQLLEPLIEPHFHEDSYGYRPGKSAIGGGWGGTSTMLAESVGVGSRYQGFL